MGRSASTIRVGVGEHNRFSSGNIMTVSALIQHSEYSSWTLANDITLLRLWENINFGNTRRAVCIPQEGHSDGYSGRELIVSGWGTISEGGKIKVFYRYQTFVYKNDFDYN